MRTSSPPRTRSSVRDSTVSSVSWPNTETAIGSRAMRQQRDLADELQAAIGRSDDDVAALVAQAREAARLEVAEILRKLFADDLLQRALRVVSGERRGL